ncbi:MAG: ABC transporter ATP-binding protein [Candidatus Sumerlaeia bacterium]
MSPCFVEFKNVHKSFGTQKVLNGLDLSVEQGVTTTIIGQSGVGKSVMLRHVAGLIRPDKGEILFCGHNILKMSSEDRKDFKHKFSYMFQNMALFDSMNVFNNIAMPLQENTDLSEKEIREKVEQQVEELDLHDVLKKYPSQISGGMRKRIALARALIINPDLILFDEPATGLDPIRKNSVHNMIQRYQKKNKFTAIMVSHEIPEVFNISDRVAVLHEGKIIYQGDGDSIHECDDRRVQQLIQGKEKEEDVEM